MTRRIRNARAADLQGTRAGAVSRFLAIAVDVGVAWGVFLVGFASIGLVWDFLHSGSVRLASPGPVVTALLTAAVFVLLLAFGTATTGRTIGKQVMGLRVVTADATRVPAGTALVRALGYLVVPIGGAWILVSRRNASLQDLACRTVVVYDWFPEVAPVVAPRGPERSAASGG